MDRSFWIMRASGVTKKDIEVPSYHGGERWLEIRVRQIDMETDPPPDNLERTFRDYENGDAEAREKLRSEYKRRGLTFEEPVYGLIIPEGLNRSQRLMWDRIKSATAPKYPPTSRKEFERFLVRELKAERVQTMHESWRWSMENDIVH